MDKKIAVIGSSGFVGRALCNVLTFRDVPYVGYHTDPSYVEPSATKEEVNGCDIAFVCVPTPMAANGSCDTSIVEEVVDWLETSLIVIKSTVAVGTTERLRHKTGKNIVHNPEFLREATASADMMFPSFTLIGGESPELEEFYQWLYEGRPRLVITSPRTSELAKYAINAFLAYKVIYFNEMKAVAETLGVDFEDLRTAMLCDPRIGDSHTEVTEEGGFGGHCFPKDLNALIHSSEEGGYKCQVLKGTWNNNRRFREEFAGEEFNFYED